MGTDLYAKLLYIIKDGDDELMTEAKEILDRGLKENLKFAVELIGVEKVINSVGVEKVIKSIDREKLLSVLKKEHII